MLKPAEALKKYWGYDAFRPMQLQAIESVLDGRDTLVLMPTGGGKSLLYQIPGIILPGVCIVVTPLIALMKDQVDRLRRRGVQALAVHSGMSMRQIDIALDNCVFGDIKFLYVSPERLSTEIFRMRAGRMNVSLIAVDEAHCISQWGYDFRPSYLQIARLRELAPKAPVLALTASATAEVSGDIIDKLHFTEPRVIRSPFSRPNISYSVRLTEDKPTQLLRILDNVAGQGIVYARTRQATEQIAAALNQRGIAAEFYHGGLAAGERSLRQDMWMNGRCRIVVATNAFGMGIDKSDVRTVVHYDICDSLEEYYQQAGRAGRDGLKSYAVLLAGPDDRSRAMRRFAVEFPSPEAIRECYEAIFNYLQVGVGDGKYASFEFNLFEFGTRNKIFPATARNAIAILEQNGYMQLTEPADLPARIMFTVSRDDLYRIRIEREELDHILRTILRLYNGVFSGFVSIDHAEIASVSGYTVDKVKELLSRLWNLRVIRYVPAGNSPLLIMQEERLPTADVRISPESYQMRKRSASDRLQAMFAYAEGIAECRSVILQRYFGDEAAQDCGVCDICILKRKVKNRPGMEESIMEMLAAQGGMQTKELVARFAVDPSAVIRAVDALLARGMICMGEDGRLRING